jgi:hypothetical protein
MSISPMTQGSTLPALQVTFTSDAGTAIDLTNGTIALALVNLASNSSTAGTGTWSVTNALQGKATYAWSLTDLATKGYYHVIITITWASGVMKFDPIPLEIR